MESTAMSTPWSEAASPAATRRDTALSFRFRSEAGRIPAAIDQVMSLVRLSGCVRGQDIQVELALHEALHNAVVHGNRRNPDTWVDVRCACDPALGVAIVIRDEGHGFDPIQAGDVTTHKGLVLRGRGLMIMKSYMDLVWFEKNGTEVHLWKNRSDPGARGLVVSGSGYPGARGSTPRSSPADRGR
jgi:serine/threonine-protein kinase RsbW